MSPRLVPVSGAVPAVRVVGEYLSAFLVIDAAVVPVSTVLIMKHDPSA